MECIKVVDHGGVAEHRDLGTGTIEVAQAEGLADDLRKMRMTGRLAIAGKGEHIWQLAFGLHLTQFGLQCLRHLRKGGHGLRGTMILVESALAVDAVERAHLAISRQQVDAEGDAEAAAVNRPEDGRRVNDC